MDARRYGGLHRVALGLLSAIVAEYLLLRLLPGVRTAWRSVADGAPVLLGLGLCLEAASILSYSALTVSILPRRSLRYWQASAIDVTGLGLSHVLPGGGATAAGLRIRLWTQRGVRAPTAVAATTIEYAVNVLWLVATLVLGSLVAAQHPSTVPAMRLALAFSTVVILVLGGVLAVLVARPDRIVSFTQWVSDRTQLLGRGTVERMVGTAVEHARLVITDHERRRRALGWGLANWGLDAMSLFACALAFGPVPNPGGVLITYGLVSLLALLPITPGGLGLVEGTAVPALVSFGVTPTHALLGVLSWRLFEFWLPIPAGVVAFTWLKLAGPGSSPATTSADVAHSEAQSRAEDQ